MDAYETRHLPVAEVPPDDGWELVTGNVTHNLWRRPGPLLKAAMLAADCLSPPRNQEEREALKALETAINGAA